MPHRWPNSPTDGIACERDCLTTVVHRHDPIPDLRIPDHQPFLSIHVAAVQVQDFSLVLAGVQGQQHTQVQHPHLWKNALLSERVYNPYLFLEA